MWSDISGPIIFAHRGASSHAPENTLPAFELAFKVGAPAIEFDVKLTKDGQVVVIHDQTVDRTTDGRGDVRNLPLAALQELNAGINSGGNFSGCRIPTLAQVFESIGSKLHMNIELTNYATPGDELVPRVVELIRKFRLEDRVLFSSFFQRNLHLAARMIPEIPRGQLAWPKLLGWVGRNYLYRKNSCVALHPFLKDTDIRLVNRVHATGQRVHVWTVNSAEDIQRLFDLGVDGIFTDDPAVALGILDRQV